MSTEVTTMIRKIYDEAFNQGNVDVLNEIIAEAYIRHQPPYNEVKGLSGFKQFVNDVRKGYTDFKIDLEEIIVADKVSVARVVLSGKHTDQTPTVQAAPTGKQVTMTGCVVSHWKDGKITQEWAYNDYLGLAQQFGVVPPPGLY